MSNDFLGACQNELQNPYGGFMKYPVVIHHDKDSAYGVSVPDIPGCFSAGETFDEALENTIEAINAHLELLAAEQHDIPKAATIETHINNPDYAGGIWSFAEIDVVPFLGQSEKINVTLPSVLIRKIDGKYKNRSKFLTEAALKALG
jgi:predicted RNase H-like HicB family nuclease